MDRDIKTILFPTSFCACTERAFPYACSTALTFNARIKAVHVVSPEDVHLPMDEPSLAREQERLHLHKMKAEEVLEGLVTEGKKQGAAVEKNILYGVTPWERILYELAVQLTDLVIMGSHNQTEVKKSGVAERVRRSSLVPCMSITNARPRIINQDRHTLNIKRILCVTDFSQRSLAPLRYAANLASVFGAHFHIIHVVENEPVAEPQWAKFIERMERQVVEVSPVGQTGIIHATPMVVAGDLVEETLDFATWRRIDLVILPRQIQRPGAQGPIEEDVERIIVAAPCPVITVNGGWQCQAT
jgi:nucleotide-binding universal stress UspA family protein